MHERAPRKRDPEIGWKLAFRACLGLHIRYRPGLQKARSQLPGGIHLATAPEEVGGGQSFLLDYIVQLRRSSLGRSESWLAWFGRAQWTGLVRERTVWSRWRSGRLLECTLQSLPDLGRRFV